MNVITIYEGVDLGEEYIIGTACQLGSILDSFPPSR